MQVEADKTKFIADQAEFKRQHRASWEVDVQEKQRFLKMADDKAAFEDAIKSRRAADFAALQVRGPRPHCHIHSALTAWHLLVVQRYLVKAYKRPPRQPQPPAHQILTALTVLAYSIHLI